MKKQIKLRILVKVTSIINYLFVTLAKSLDLLGPSTAATVESALKHTTTIVPG
jgi:hypothetical protein